MNDSNRVNFFGILFFFTAGYFIYDAFQNTKLEQATKSNFLSDYNLTEGIWDQTPEKNKGY